MTKDEIIDAHLKEIDRLNKEIAQLKGTSLKRRCGIEPIIGVAIDANDDHPYIERSGDYFNLWNQIRILALKIFLKDNIFSFRETQYVRINDYLRQADLTDEQLELASNYAKEMVELHDKYVMLANPKIRFLEESYGWEDCKEVYL